MFLLSVGEFSPLWYTMFIPFQRVLQGVNGFLFVKIMRMKSKEYRVSFPVFVCLEIEVIQSRAFSPINPNPVRYDHESESFL